MRLREPFSGYKLSSGHFMFHMAFLLGSYYADNYVINPSNNGPGAKDVLFQLNLAHILVPVFTFCSIICNYTEWQVLEKVFDIVSIFQYQATIFYAQFYQMNCKTNKLEGLNLWFIIEILSFYGYIMSAIWFIFESRIKSSLGWSNKQNVKDRYKYDFINYHRKDLDWLAFVTILCMVNIALVTMEHTVLETYVPTNKENDVRKVSFKSPL